MKRFIAIAMAAVMTLSMSAVAAFAETRTDQFLTENGSTNLPDENDVSQQDVKITIKAVKDSSSGEGGNTLPSEYDVLVNWDTEDGVYDATASDSSEDGGFKNFAWKWQTLEYEVNSPNVGEGETDPRKANWTTEPKAKFEVVNASTPDLPINAKVDLDGDDAWANYLTSNKIDEQNATFGTKTIAPVTPANLGSGDGKGKSTKDTNYAGHEYELNWDYEKLNQKALDLYQNGGGSETLTNTFVVTISK